MIRYLLAGVMAGFLLLFSFVAMAGSPEDAADYAISVGNEATAILDEPISTEEKRLKLSTLFIEHVDTDWIGKFVLGRSWRSLSNEKRAQYLQYYQDFLISQYTSNFREYAQGTRFEITQSRHIGSRGGQYLVTTRIESDNGEPVKVDYRVRGNADGSYSVIDIVVEGVSLLATQRSEFSSVVERKGIDYLIGKLKARSVEIARQAEAAQAEEQKAQMGNSNSATDTPNAASN